MHLEKSKDSLQDRNRIRYIDFAKGFAILLLLLSHCLTVSNSLKAWITSFNMPIFFMLVGILNSQRYCERQTNKNDVVTLIKKRLFQLWLPYIIWSLVLSSFYILINCFSHRKVDVASYILRILSLQGIDSMWFIPVVFFAELLLVISFSKKWTKILLPILSFTISNTYYVLIGSNSYNQELYIMIIRVIIKILIAYVFMFIGYSIDRLFLLSKISIWISIPLAVLGIVLSSLNGEVGIGGLILGYPVLFWINATVSSIALLLVFRFYENNKIGEWLKLLEFYGKNTMVVLCTNNLMIETIRLLDYKLADNYLLRINTIGSVLLFAILMAVEYFIILLSKGKLSVLFGKGCKNGYH